MGAHSSPPDSPAGSGRGPRDRKGFSRNTKGRDKKKLEEEEGGERRKRWREGKGQDSIPLLFFPLPAVPQTPQLDLRGDTGRGKGFQGTELAE